MLISELMEAIELVSISSPSSPASLAGILEGREARYTSGVRGELYGRAELFVETDEREVLDRYFNFKSIHR